MSAREDLQNYLTVAEALIGTSNIDNDKFVQLKKNIEKYSKNDQEIDGQELNTTSGVEKFDDSDKLLKSDIDLLKEAGLLLRKI